MLLFHEEHLEFSGSSFDDSLSQVYRAVVPLLVKLTSLYGREREIVYLEIITAVLHLLTFGFVFCTFRCYTRDRLSFNTTLYETQKYWNQTQGFQQVTPSSVYIYGRLTILKLNLTYDGFVAIWRQCYNNVQKTEHLVQVRIQDSPKSLAPTYDFAKFRPPPPPPSAFSNQGFIMGFVDNSLR